MATASQPPLDGLRVIDLTRFLAGPFCTQILGDYGADVIKVEERNGRELRPAGADRDSYFFLSANRSKRSMTLDIRTEDGRRLLFRLLEDADVIVENYRPGVMQRLGLGPESLTERFPRLVYCGISGFGSTGPYARRPGFDQIAQGMSGFMSLTGTSESGPTRAGIAIADVLAGIFACQGIQFALLARERTGRGQIVETSLLESMIGILSWGAGMFFERGEAPGPAGQHHPLASPYGRFRASDGYLNIAPATEAMWRRLATVLGHEEWIADPRFDTRGRVRNRAELTSEIETVLGTDTVEVWVGRLNDAEVPAGPVMDIAEVFADPQVLARDMLVRLSHPEIGTYQTTGLPVKLSETPGSITIRPPLHGEHTDEILGELGIGPAELAELRERAVI